MEIQWLPRAKDLLIYWTSKGRVAMRERERERETERERERERERV